MDPLSAGVAVAVALVGGGLLTAFVGLRKAPVEESTALATAATGHAGVLLADNEDLREEVAGLRRDWAHDREELRQLRAANEGLRDENEHLRAQLRDKGVTP